MSDVVRIEIRVYGSLRDILGWEKKILSIPRGESLKRILNEEIPEIFRILSDNENIIFVFNKVIVPIRDLDNYRIQSDGELDILPSIIGGAVDNRKRSFY